MGADENINPFLHVIKKCVKLYGTKICFFIGSHLLHGREDEYKEEESNLTKKEKQKYDKAKKAVESTWDEGRVKWERQ